MRERLSAQIAVCATAIWLSGCNILMAPINMLKGVFQFLAGLAETLGPLALLLVQGPAVTPVTPPEPPAHTRPAAPESAPIDEQLVRLYQGKPALTEALEPAELAELARQKQARSLVLIDLRDMSEAQARRWLALLAAHGEVRLLDAAPLVDPAARAALAASLRRADVAVVEAGSTPRTTLPAAR